MSKMQFPSFTLIFSGLFIAYNTYSIYAISQFFSPPPCKSEEYCITSCLKKQLNLKLDLFTSITRHPLNAEVTKVYTDTIFDYTQAKDIPLTLDIPHKTRKNGTLFMHVVLSTISSKPDLTFNQLIKDFDTVYTTIKMTEYALPHTEAYNLLSKDKSRKTKKQDQIPKTQPIAHLKSKITFTIMTDDVQFPINNIPMELANFMKVNNNLQFLPLLNYNFLHTRHENLEKITPKSHSMNVTVTYSPISLGKLRLILHIQEVMQNFKDLGFTDKDVDQVKSILADTNLYLLAATVFISAMHLLFDFLAFKNDISFWKNINNLAGLSTKTVIWCAFSRTVIFLYLLDEESSLLILIPSGIATIIEFWKTKKLLKAEFVWSGSYFPRIRFNLNKSTSAEAKTREFDAESMRYLSYLLYPLVILGAIYSLLYLPHKSWYSWCLHSTVKGVYAFGFLFMLPQLFVNYKLKSVAHLPWKSFMYKAFNTFIDDVFAFIITMPTAHRVACFRDDVVFLIYLYQRWLYPVDKSRIDSSTVDQDPGALDDVMQKKKK